MKLSNFLNEKDKENKSYRCSKCGKKTASKLKKGLCDTCYNKRLEAEWEAQWDRENLRDKED